VLFVAVLIFVGIFRSIAGTVFFYVFNPIASFFDATEWPVPFVAFSNTHRELAVKYEELLREHTAMTGTKEAYDALLKTYTAESVIGQESEEGIPAIVLLRAPVAGFDTMVIAAGSKQGVSVGMLVRTGAGVLVGEIREVSRAYSKVTLYSRSGETRYMENKRNLVAISVEGIGAGSLLARVPKGTDVLEGDVLVIPGLPHLPVAKIERVITSEAEAYMSLYASLIAPYSSLESVYVINAPTF